MNEKKSALATCIASVGWCLAAGPALGAENISDLLAARDYVRGGAVTHIVYGHMQSWEKLDDQHLLILAGESGDFLLGFRRPCRDLDPSLDVTFTVSAGKITDADRVTIEWENGQRKFCYISRLNRLKQLAH